MGDSQPSLDWRPGVEDYGLRLTRHTKGIRVFLPGQTEPYSGSFRGGTLHPADDSLVILYHGDGFIQYLRGLPNMDASPRFVRVNLSSSIRLVNGQVLQEEERRKAIAARGVLTQGQSLTRILPISRSRTSTGAPSGDPEDRDEATAHADPSVASDEHETAVEEETSPAEEILTLVTPEHEEQTNTMAARNKRRVQANDETTRRKGGHSSYVQEFATWLLSLLPSGKDGISVPGLLTRSKKEFSSGPYFLQQIVKYKGAKMTGKQGREAVFELDRTALQKIAGGNVEMPVAEKVHPAVNSGKAEGTTAETLSTSREHLITIRHANAALRKLTDEEREALRKLTGALEYFKNMGFSVRDQGGLYTLEP